MKSAIDIYNDHIARVGDRTPLLAMVADRYPVTLALYPGSSVDITPSFAFRSVTYVDSTKRTAEFFEDTEAIERLIENRKRYKGPFDVGFLPMDYTEPLPETDGSFELLLSFSAGFVSEACKRYLSPGGWLLADDSDGDASLAAIDPDFSLVGVVSLQRDGRFRFVTDSLDGYMIPKRATEVTAESLRSRRKGMSYTRTAYAYLFQLAR